MGVERLKLVLQAGEHGLNIRSRKCQLIEEKIEYLGYDV